MLIFIIMLSKFEKNWIGATPKSYLSPFGQWRDSAEILLTQKSQFRFIEKCIKIKLIGDSGLRQDWVQTSVQDLISRWKMWRRRKVWCCNHHKYFVFVSLTKWNFQVWPDSEFQVGNLTADCGKSALLATIGNWNWTILLTRSWAGGFVLEEGFSD